MRFMRVFIGPRLGSLGSESRVWKHSGLGIRGVYGLRGEGRYRLGGGVQSRLQGF